MLRTQHRARRRSSRRRAPNCPSWARTRTLLIPYPLRLSPPPNTTSVRGLDCAFTFAVTRSGGSHPVSTPSPPWGLARRYQSRVRRLREHSHTSFPAWCPASAPTGAARVRRVASYTKGQRSFSSRLASSQDEDHFTRKRGPGQLRLTPGCICHESDPVCSWTSDETCLPRVRVVRSQESEHSGLGNTPKRTESSKGRP